MPAPRRSRKDRISLLIAAALHAVLIGGVLYWAHRTGRLESVRRVLLQYAGAPQPGKKTPPHRPVGSSAAPHRRLDPGAARHADSGTRRAVVSEAPPGVGETFFQDRRPALEATAAGGLETVRAAAAPKIPAPPPPRPAFAPPPRATIRQLLAERARAAASVEAVGAEQIARVAASDAAAALSRVSGAAVVEGKFAVIRGLTDRYVSTTLNQAEIPSADPYRRSASLDQFPAALIERVVVSKTFTPDQPGSASGGSINIVTRSFPPQPFVSLSVGTAYNSQATFTDQFLWDRRGRLDWLGMDDGGRALPVPLRNLEVDLPVPPVSANLRDPAEVASKIEQADAITRALQALGRAQFAPTRGAAPMDHQFALAAGDTTHLLGVPLGVLGALNYRREFRFARDQVARRWKWDNGRPSLTSDYSDNIASDTVNWSAMATLSLGLHPDHTAGVNFLFNQNALSLARLQESGFSESQPGATFVQNRLQWVERNLRTLQFKGEHLFAALGDLKLDWTLAQSVTSQDEPDTRFFNFYSTGDLYVIGTPTLPNPQDPTRYFRHLEEQNLNPRVDLTLPFRLAGAEQGRFKTGLTASWSERRFEERQIRYKLDYGSPPFTGDPNAFLSADNLGYSLSTNASRTRVNFDFGRYIQNADSTYRARADVQAAYGMLELPLSGALRLIGGVRLEQTELQIDSVSYIGNDVTGSPVNSTRLQQADLLPALGLIWAIRTNMNLRLNYSRTLARPSVRELAALRSYDPVLDVEVDGNPTLQITTVDNYDVRWEWFPRPGEIISIGLFYKSLRRPIELYSRSADDRLLTFINRDSGQSFGLELELRQSLALLSPWLADFSLGGNFSWIESSTELTPAELANRTASLGATPRRRPLYDTAPYLVNLDLSYDNPRIGTSASLIFQTAGPRIVFASQTKKDVYEQPAPTLDLVFSQKLGRSLTLRLTARNLLNPVIRRTYGRSEQTFSFQDPLTFEKRSLSNLYSTSRRGITVAVSLGYEF